MSSELQGISSGLAAAAAIAATTYLLHTVRPVARQEGGLAVVEYGKAMKFLVVIFWLFVVGASVAAAFAPSGDRIFAYSMVAVFFLLVLPLHLEFFHVSVRFDVTGLHTASPWRRGRFIPWSSITGVRFSPLAQWYVLSTSQLGHIRLHLYLSGLQTLLDELARRGFAIPASPQRRQ